MRIRNILFLAAAPAVLMLSGCEPQPFRADVTRFQQMPAPQGQTFVVQAADPRLEGGIEFQQYANLVAARLTEQGYQQAVGGASASLVVSLDYGVDNGHEKVVTTPGFGYGYGGYGPWGYGGFGRPFYGRGWYSGWADPFWYQPFGGPEVSSYTFYVSHLEVKIRSAADSHVLFEGRAQARSTDNSLQHLVPNLVEAMFTSFPGRSGEAVLITVPPPPKPGAPINH